MDNAREISADAPGEDVFLPRLELPFLTVRGHAAIENGGRFRAVKCLSGFVRQIGLRRKGSSVELAPSPNFQSGQMTESGRRRVS